ncbi:hypothetical protein CW304_27610 [Bacillus sp. UFRGS-B20]|nr:hypothetical protein CW304_27610 [Bacillus sp. UFRGS-B20]
MIKYLFYLFFRFLGAAYYLSLTNKYTISQTHNHTSIPVFVQNWTSIPKDTLSSSSILLTVSNSFLVFLHFRNIKIIIFS